MKHFIVYANGSEIGFVKARHHNQAEEKAKKKYGSQYPDGFISVEGTEI